MIWYIVVIVVFILTMIIVVVDDYRHSDLSIMSGLLSVFSSVALLIFIICTIIANSSTEAKGVRLNAEREAIVYQLEHKTYLNDNNLGTHEVFEDASNFNQRVLCYRELKHNPWTSWLYSPIWDSIEPIDFENLK